MLPPSRTTRTSTGVMSSLISGPPKGSCASLAQISASLVVRGPHRAALGHLGAVALRGRHEQVHDRLLELDHQPLARLLAHGGREVDRLPLGRGRRQLLEVGAQRGVLRLRVHERRRRLVDAQERHRAVAARLGAELGRRRHADHGELHTALLAQRLTHRGHRRRQLGRCLVQLVRLVDHHEHRVDAQVAHQLDKGRVVLEEQLVEHHACEHDGPRLVFLEPGDQLVLQMHAPRRLGVDRAELRRLLVRQLGALGDEDGERRAALGRLTLEPGARGLAGDARLAEPGLVLPVDEERRASRAERG
eukprot:1586307-Prymnesium_polylepis.1